MTATKWIVTIPDTIIEERDGATITQTVHVECATREQAADLVGGIFDEFGPVDGIKGVEVPSTWECDGRDNCMVMA